MDTEGVGGVGGEAVDLSGAVSAVGSDDGLVVGSAVGDRGGEQLGGGPVEGLVMAVERGEVSASSAVAMAAEPDVAAAMQPGYVLQLKDHAIGAAYRGEPEHGVLVLRLVLAALHWRDTGRAIEPHVREAILGLLVVADLALVEQADRRLLDEARAAGDHLQQVASAAGQTDVVGRALFLLGDLLCHPYLAGRYSGTFSDRHEAWEAASRVVRASRSEAGAGVDQAEMPEPDEALAAGEDYLRRAVELLVGPDKGRALYQLIGTLVVRHVLAHPERAGNPDMPPEVRGLALSALPLLADSDDLRSRLGVLDVLDRAEPEGEGDPVPVAEVLALVDVPHDEMVRRLGGVSTLDVQFRLATLLRRRDRATALAVLQRMRPLAKAHGDEAAREHHLAQEFAYIARAWAPEVAELSDDTAVDDVAALADQLHRSGLWDARAQGAAALNLAQRFVAAGQTLPALRFLDQAAAVAPALVAAHADAVALQRWVATFGAMGELAAIGDSRQVVGAAQAALEIALDLDLPDLAGKTLEMVRLHAEADPTMARPVCTLVVDWALRVEDALGPAAGETIWQLCVIALAVMVDQAESPADVDRIIALLQLGRGLRFSAAHQNPWGWQHLVDGVGGDELQMIRVLQEQVGDVAHLGEGGAEGEGADEVRQQDQLLDEQLLTSYARPEAAGGGRGPGERLANLQQRYDETLSDALLHGARERPPVLLTGGDLQRSIDERTIVVVLYIGADVRGMLAVYAFAFSKDRVATTRTVHDMPLGHLRLEGAERGLVMSPLAPAVTALRTNLLADPGLRDAAPAAADSLAADEQGFLGNLRAQLDRMKDESGGTKDHVVFVPHGPLHFYPLHLLGERPLTDDWIVTYLPVLSMVAPRRGLPSLAQRPRNRAAVLGMGFDADPRPGLPPLPGSRREAEAVASILETRALLDDDCTAGTLLDGLTSSYWAHLSTHGRHNVAAPAFQSLYLTPDQHFPGRLEAHDVLGHDLRNLDLLTLSACETSLGRFDIRDNLRGLPASFLLAGVETLIGTLWPVEVNASERFFTTLYRLLADGRPKLDAFRSAQDETRAEFPQFRDWGAFHYVGQW